MKNLSSLLVAATLLLAFSPARAVKVYPDDPNDPNSASVNAYYATATPNGGG